jgi:hypothetical protein
VTASYATLVDEAGVEAWQSSLRAAEGGAGAGRPEFQLIATGVSQGWPAARKLYDQWQGGAGVLESMQVGDEITVKKAGEAGGQAGLDVKSGPVSVGAGVEAKTKREVLVSFKKEDKATIASCKITDTLSSSVGGKVGYGVVGMSGSAGRSSTEGRGYAFTVPHDYPGASGLVAELAGIMTKSQLEAFAARHRNLIGAKTSVEGSADERKIGYDIGPAKLGMEFGGDSEHEHTDEYDPTTGELVKKTDKHTGHSKLGGNAKFGPLAFGQSSNEGIASTVVTERDEKTGAWKQVAKADVSDVDSESGVDLEGTLDNLKNPDLLNLATGSKELIAKKQKVEVAGFFMDDSDFRKLAGAASDEAKWNGSCLKGDLNDWAALGAQIRAARGDRGQIAAALSQYKKKSGGASTNKNVEDVLDVKSGKAGERYEFPDGLGGLKSEYGALVVNDPMSKVDKLVSESKLAEAARKATELADACASLENKLNANRSEFKDASTFMGMIKKLGDQRTALKTRAIELTAKADGKTVNPELLDRMKASETFNQLYDQCRSNKSKETQVLAEISKLKRAFGRDEAQVIEKVNQLRRRVPEWKKSYGEMCRLDDLHHCAANKDYLDYKPDEARLKVAYEGGDPNGSAGEAAAAEVRDQAIAQKDAVARQREDLPMLMSRMGGVSGAVINCNVHPPREPTSVHLGHYESSISEGRAAATKAKGKCNLLTAGGTWDKVAKPAMVPYNRGFALFNEAEAKWKQAQAAFQAKTMIPAIAVPTTTGYTYAFWGLADRAKAAFAESAARFAEGDVLQG